jgi:hypothetical protein
VDEAYEVPDYAELELSNNLGENSMRPKEFGCTSAAHRRDGRLQRQNQQAKKDQLEALPDADTAGAAGMDWSR